jgi:hypothetical protein
MPSSPDSQTPIFFQFGRPSGVAIDKNDVLYVADSQSTQQNNPGFRRASASAAPRTAR